MISKSGDTTLTSPVQVSLSDGESVTVPDGVTWNVTIICYGSSDQAQAFKGEIYEDRIIADDGLGRSTDITLMSGDTVAASVGSSSSPVIVSGEEVA